jgi:formylglycine-generating enzyme required for sulfatase activity
LGPIELGLPDATLIVQSQPAGARVTAGGVYRGQTPLTIVVRPNLQNSIEIARPGFAALTRTVQLRPSERTTLDVALEPILGEVTIRSNHPDAEVLVDGVSSGRANATLSLPAVEHRIEVRKAGFVSHQATVTPRPGLAQVVEATLRTESELRAARVPPVIRAASSIELRLLPQGSFTMGSGRREPGRRANEAPRAVELRRPFYLGTREISNAEFHRFRSSHQSGVFAGLSLNLETQPVAQVSWQDAAAYCNWLSQQDGLPSAYQPQGGELVAVVPMNNGYRLPTEAEWEWAARHRPDGTLWRYPWGNELPVAARSGNYADLSARTPLQDVISDYDDGFVAAAPVGSFTATNSGLFDIGGNVAEWTTDLYTTNYAADEVAIDPLNGGAGNQHVVRGASWRSSSVVELRSAMRSASVAPRDDLGFRIARYAE